MHRAPSNKVSSRRSLLLLPLDPCIQCNHVAILQRHSAYKPTLLLCCDATFFLQIPVSKPKQHPKAKLLPKSMTKEERREMLNKLHKAERQAKWEAEHPRKGEICAVVCF